MDRSNIPLVIGAGIIVLGLIASAGYLLYSEIRLRVVRRRLSLPLLAGALALAGCTSDGPTGPESFDPRFKVVKALYAPTVGGQLFYLATEAGTPFTCPVPEGVSGPEAEELVGETLECDWQQRS